MAQTKDFQEFEKRLVEISDIHSAADVLAWDQMTYMPNQGAAARARQMASLSKIAHEKLTTPEMGKLLDRLTSVESEHPSESYEASLIRVGRRIYEKSTKIPSDFLGEFYEHAAKTYGLWAEARPKNDFQSLVPALKKTLDYSKRMAEFFPGFEHIADPLIDSSDEGVKVSDVKPLFESLRNELVPLVKKIKENPPVSDSCLFQEFPEKEQIEFGVNVIKDMGYDFERGRQDKTHHPFMTRFASGDVRITTRARKDFFGECLFSTVHEAGHALYELGVDPKLDGTPLGHGTSSGVHESQSRLWENLVARSLPFWKYYYPVLQKKFPSQFSKVELKEFYRAINRVETSLIRTDADEVTYNLHVMIRFDLELAMLEEKLKIEDLPEAWNERYKADLGVVPENDQNGCMQDVHWYSGAIGGSFQGYTIGNIFSAQCFEAATKAKPEILGEIEAGKFSTLRFWLNENLHSFGSKLTGNEAIKKCTGSPLSIKPYMQYLKAKYGEIYAI